MPEHVAEARGRSRGRIPLVLLVILVALAVATTAFAGWAVWTKVIEPAISAASQAVGTQTLDAETSVGDKAPDQAVYSYEMTNVAPDGSENALDDEENYAFWYPVLSTTGDSAGVDRVNAAIREDATGAWELRQMAIDSQREFDEAMAREGGGTWQRYHALYHVYVTQLNEETASLVYQHQYSQGTIGTGHSVCRGATYSLVTGEQVDAAELCNTSSDELLALSEQVVSDYYLLNYPAAQPSVRYELGQSAIGGSGSYDPPMASYCVLDDGVAISYYVPFGEGVIPREYGSIPYQSVVLFVKAFDEENARYSPGKVIDLDEIEARMPDTTDGT